MSLIWGEERYEKDYPGWTSPKFYYSGQTPNGIKIVSPGLMDDKYYKSLQGDGNFHIKLVHLETNKGAVPRASESPNKSLVALSNVNCNTSSLNNSAPSNAWPVYQLP